MSGFIYNEKNTNTILPNTKLVLASTDGGFDNAIGVDRELLRGEPSINRPIVNEYGTSATHLEFRYSLIKCDGTDFTESEQRTIETWLTSPKFSSPLEIFDDNGNIRVKYYGLFRLTSWETAQEGWAACNFVFSVNGSYAFEHYTYSYTSTSTTGNWTFSVNCPSDELEEWVYPKITLKRYSTDYSVSMTLTSITDNNNTLTISTSRKDTFYIDCKNCILSEQSGLVNFAELGWDDVANIYWPRLKSGTNNFRCKGAVNLTFDFDVPVKIVGGWLV